jgi:hypothetical protein
MENLSKTFKRFLDVADQMKKASFTTGHRLKLGATHLARQDPIAAGNKLFCRITD